MGDSVFIIKDHYHVYSELKDRIGNFGFVTGDDCDANILIVDFNGKKMFCSPEHLRKVEIVHPSTFSQPTDIDTTITQRGERYGKFKDGSVIMQDLKNIMRETPNWEGLTPSQREALEMIQHKIGRILNGDPMYDDNWRDICGYSQLVLDELNGTVR